MIPAGNDPYTEVAAAAKEAIGGRRPFFCAWLHPDGTVRYAVYEATPLLVMQAAQAFLAACGVPAAGAPILPQPIDPTV